MPGGEAVRGRYCLKKREQYKREVRTYDFDRIIIRIDETEGEQGRFSDTLEF